MLFSHFIFGKNALFELYTVYEWWKTHPLGQWCDDDRNYRQPSGREFLRIISTLSIIGILFSSYYYYYYYIPSYSFFRTTETSLRINYLKKRIVRRRDETIRFSLEFYGHDLETAPALLREDFVWKDWVVATVKFCIVLGPWPGAEKQTYP